MDGCEWKGGPNLNQQLKFFGLCVSFITGYNLSWKFISLSILSWLNSHVFMEMGTGYRFLCLFAVIDYKPKSWQWLIYNRWFLKFKVGCSEWPRDDWKWQSWWVIVWRDWFSSSFYWIKKSCHPLLINYQQWCQPGISSYT